MNIKGYNFLIDKDLLEKDKSELDRIKVALEISTFKDKYDFDKRKYRGESMRVFAIALMTSIITLGSTYIFKRFDHISADRKDINNLCNNLINNFHNSNGNPVKQGSFACEIAQIENVYNDISLDRKLAIYKRKCAELTSSNDIVSSEKNKINDIDIYSEENQKYLAKISSYEKKINELQNHKALVSPRQREEIDKQIYSENKKILAIADSSKEIKQALLSTAIISSNVEEQIKLSSNDLGSSPKSNIKWFKEGYFIRFDDDMRVFLLDLDKNRGIKVQVCQTKVNERCQDPIVKGEWLSFKKPLIYQHDGIKYKINLEAIDHAGKNPLKLAAYITFDKLL